jgi:signal peptidase I
MFGPFASQHRKTLTLAADWLELADKVYHYRRDVLSAADLTALAGAQGNVRTLVSNKADTARLKLAIDALEAVLRRTGGHHYPKSSLVENVEFFLIAAIVILGIRTFYVQPFKIPTNSMWPSYYGMTGEVFQREAEEPSAAARLLRFAAFGATPRRVDANAAGEILLPLSGDAIAYNPVKGRSLLVFPAVLREYRIFIGKSAVSFRVPSDFDMDTVFRDTFFPGDKRRLNEIIADQRKHGLLEEVSYTTPRGLERGRLLRTGKTVSTGDRALSFDVLTGDNLFVDRVSYHFVRPSVGDGFVFRTGNLPRLHALVAPNSPKDQYYIKRLVGLPGDTLRIAQSVLYRNGAPITGAPAFDKNAQEIEKYVGYRAEGNFSEGQTVVVEQDRYMAMGDNSANSLDGRYWGTIPVKDTIGRPIVIYYPFTKRWGLAP